MIAAIALVVGIVVGLRIGQYGLTPDRLWAIIFVSIAFAYGAAYLYALVRRRQRWSELARPINLYLALGLCGLAFLLSKGLKIILFQVTFLDPLVVTLTYSVLIASAMLASLIPARRATR